jgi:hypothetical protein
MLHQRSRLIWILLLSVIALCAVFIIICVSEKESTMFGRKSWYLSDEGYAQALGIDRLECESINKVYGEPESIERWFDPAHADRELVKHSYRDFDVLYFVDSLSTGEEQLVFIQLVIKTNLIHFGFMQVGVGVRRGAVRFAYMLDPKLSKSEIEYESNDFPEVDEGFYGENWCRIMFDYDDSGIVKEMAYSISPN